MTKKIIGLVCFMSAIACGSEQGNNSLSDVLNQNFTTTEYKLANARSRRQEMRLAAIDQATEIIRRQQEKQAEAALYRLGCKSEQILGRRHNNRGTRIKEEIDNMRNLRRNRLSQATLQTLEEELMSSDDLSQTGRFVEGHIPAHVPGLKLDNLR